MEKRIQWRKNEGQRTPYDRSLVGQSFLAAICRLRWSIFWPAAAVPPPESEASQGDNAVAVRIVANRSWTRRTKSGQLRPRQNHALVSCSVSACATWCREPMCARHVAVRGGALPQRDFDW